MDLKNKFRMCFLRVSHEVLNLCSPKFSQNLDHTFTPYALLKSCPSFHLCAGLSKEEANPSPSSNRNFYIDEPQKFQNFVFFR